MNQFCFGTKEGKVAIVNYMLDENKPEWQGYHDNFTEKAQKVWDKKERERKNVRLGIRNKEEDDF